MLQRLLESPATRELARALVSDFTLKGEVKILGRPYYIEPDPDNVKVFDAVRRHPGRFLGWVFVNPRGKRDPVLEFERYRDAPGFVGVKAHPFCITSGPWNSSRWRGASRIRAGHCSSMRDSARRAISRPCSHWSQG